MQSKRKNIKINALQIMVLGFAGVILLGAILLWLPICNTKPIAFIDALFTATTATCVTGLVTIVPAQQFTIIGKIILLILIQIGGLGVIACATVFVVIMGRKLSVKNRILLQESYSMSGPGGTVAMLLYVIKGTLVVEGIGAIGYALQFIPEFGLFRGIWYSIFHSISAFCNAGIDILGADSLKNYVTNPVINIVTILLIIVSGLGFVVWKDLIYVAKSIYRREISARNWFSKLHLHSKLVLVVTAILIVVGAFLFFVIEFHNPQTIGDFSVWDKFVASLFHSVSTRTAGFATISQSGLRTESKFITCLLMFIGGSPGGTAGGVKTTTIAMAILTCFSIAKGGEKTECFGRRMKGKDIRIGFAVIMMAVTVLFTGIIFITSMEPQKEFIDIIYEAASAVGTVGLTADLTQELCRKSQIIIIIMMYIGRIGPMSLALAFGSFSKDSKRKYELPSENIMIG
ncbi:MAG: TrkH family potassium uptake protein [Lachnospiraceae bacterium]